jgi:cysteine-rich repeat protein
VIGARRAGEGRAFVVGPCGNGVVDAGEECDDGNANDGDCCTAACDLDTTPCHGALSQRASIDVRERTSGRGRSADYLLWSWVSSAAVAKSDFGNPLATADITLCLLDQTGGTPTLRLSATAPAGSTCAGKPCWKEKTLGYDFKSRDLYPHGLAKVSLLAGAAGQAKIRVQGRRAPLALPGLPLATPVTVRLRRSDAAVCWEAIYDSGVILNDAANFKATSD